MAIRSPDLSPAWPVSPPSPDTPITPRGFRPTRRTLFALGVGALVVATLPRARRDRRERVVRTFLTMGTIAEVTVLDEDTRRANAAIDAAAAELDRLERVLTRFDDASEVGRANLRAGIEPIAVGAETALVVEEALRWAEASDGAFDPCLSRAIDVWDVLHRTVPPEQALVRRYAGRRLHRSVDVERTATGGVIRFRDADVGLDLGAIAKGYSIDRAADVLRSLGVRDAIVKVGGDLVALGRGETGNPWRIGVRSPSDPDGICGTLDVSDAAVATSGDYERFFDWQGHRYHHILDPATAAPRVTPLHSSTVTAPTCFVADAASTSVFGRPREWADRLLAHRAPGARIASVV
jgi:thiamine biosynthesis lipoprotein